MGVVEFFEQKTRHEETLHKTDDTDTNNIPVCFVKKASKTIRARSLYETKLGNGLTNFKLLRDYTDEGIFIMGNHRGKSKPSSSSEEGLEEVKRLEKNSVKCKPISFLLVKKEPLSSSIEIVELYLRWIAVEA